MTDSSLTSLPGASATAVLIVSCDRYADLWKPFFQCFWKYWSDCPYPVYLGTGLKTLDDKRVTSLSCGEDLGYCANLRQLLGRLSHEWIILWVEDRLISGPVQTADLRELINGAQLAGAGYLKLIPEHPIGYDCGNARMGDVPRGTTYRASLTVGLWRKSCLLELLRDDENAWQFERYGSRRSDALSQRFLGLSPRFRRSPPIPHVHVINKGRLIRAAKHFLQKEGLYSELKHRCLEPWSARVYTFIYNLLFRLARPMQHRLLVRRRPVVLGEKKTATRRAGNV